MIIFGANDVKIYEGGWLREKFEGQGVLYNEAVGDLRGSFNCNDFNSLENNWVKYEGTFKDGMREGEGRLYLTNAE